MTATASTSASSSTSTIKPIDQTSIHRITSGQVVIDLQTAVKELVENSIDAGATSVEVRFKNYGIRSIEVIDNGSGIAEADHDSIALKHHTSKLSKFTDLDIVRTFGFRGEALSSLCAVSESLSVTTATEHTAPMGVALEMEVSGKVKSRKSVARQRGTTIAFTNLFLPLPVRRKELERNVKREFSKALALLNAYALGPCSQKGVRLNVSNLLEKGQRSVPMRTQGTDLKGTVSSLWGPKAMDNVVPLELEFEVHMNKRLKGAAESVHVQVKGLISRFTVGGGRTGTDRQFLYVNGRPCNLPKIQKAINETYRTFNVAQSPFVVADFIVPTQSYDVNVSPDKRTIFLHGEADLISGLKEALESTFAPSRATFDVSQKQGKGKEVQSVLGMGMRSVTNNTRRINALAGSGGVKQVQDVEEDVDDGGEEEGISRNTKGAGQNIGDTEGPTPQRHNARKYPISPPTAPARTSRPPSTSLPKSASAPTQSTSLYHDPVLPQRVSRTPSPRFVPIAGSALHAESQSRTLGSNTKEPLFVPESEEENEPEEENSVVVPAVSGLTEKDNDMDIDERAEGNDDGNEDITLVQQSPLKRNKEKEAVMVIDTTRAIWSQSVLPSQPSKPPSTRENRGSEEKNEPVRKKRRSEVGSLVCTSKVTQSTTKESREHLRNRLVGFARTGSQVPIEYIQDDDEESKEEEGEEDQEEEEVDQLDEDVLPKTREKQKAKVVESMSINEDEESTVVGTGAQSSTLVNANPPDIDEEEEEEPPDPSSVLSQALANPKDAVHAVPAVRREVIKSSDTGGDVTLRFDVQLVAEHWKLLARASHPVVSENHKAADTRVLADAGVANNEQDKATDALARIIEKGDFATMEILGQFNLGFIVVRRRKAVGSIVEGAAGSHNSGMDVEDAETQMDDLFIVDQHAADEKYNFETLQQTTRIQSQKLFRPQPLELTASDQLLAIENMEVLRQNGFEVDVHEDEVDDENSGQRSRLQLTAQPVSKNTIFDMKDLEELVHLMRDRPAGQMVRCSKARAMFASRACRKSVMIGMPLNRRQMTTVVQHMGTMDQPWNCPHGRPTMRHLVDLSDVGRTTGFGGRSVPAGVDWSAFH